MVTELPKINPAGRFTVRQAAKVLGVHYNTLYNKIRGMKIKCRSREDSHHAFLMGIDIIAYFNSTSA